MTRFLALCARPPAVEKALRRQVLSNQQIVFVGGLAIGMAPTRVVLCVRLKKWCPRRDSNARPSA